MMVLAEVLKTVPNGLEKSERNRFASALGNNPSNIYLRKEYSGDGTRIDLLIYTRNGIPKQDLLIGIEFKIGSGNETSGSKNSNESQTKREWKMLEKERAKLQIYPENLLALFISPSGKDAASSNFYSVSFRQFNAAIIQGLECVQGHEDTVGTFKHFFNSKTIF